MDRFGVIGWPAAHSQSPRLFAEACGGKYPYDIIETPSFEEAWKTFAEGPYRAVNVTMPFKKEAAARADVKGQEVERIGAANILIKTPDGIVARNSDYLGLVGMLKPLVPEVRNCAVIGLGGAGLAAAAAAQDCGIPTKLFHHDEIAGGVSADLVIFTLPRNVEGTGLLKCRYLLEANYRDPFMQNGPWTYISGEQWLECQARCGFAIMLEGK